MARPKKRRRLKQYYPGMPFVRWGHLFELDRRTRVGSAAWYANHPETRLRKLSAWRCLHALARHTQIRWAARFRGVDPSSDIPLREMVRMVERHNKTGKFNGPRQKRKRPPGKSRRPRDENDDET